ncbi:type II secretion system protein GspM [Motilimonas pumila]|uniref:MSHA biogenesis protein MshJ n=1 Tax=Motilimonas pumila TaxID=2303987 RepID=A0A418YIC0_9GAMM|nr:type II secretion system protein GspM [Motilimonas pumila]RJG49971.1 MSHA biogenesis protein MshJ [Motilimonas pumila]
MNGWQGLTEKVAALSIRERVMVFITGCVIIAFPGYSYFIEPAQKRFNQQQVLHQQNLQQQTRVKGEIDIAQILLKRDPDEPARNALKVILQSIQQTDLQLNQGTVDLISSDKMAAALEQLLNRSQKLKLVELSSIAPTPLLPTEGDFSEDINLFQHGLKLKFTGQYFSIRSYLTELEQLPEKFYWQSLRYQVQQYPQAEVELYIYTLSTNKDFIRG